MEGLQLEVYRSGARSLKPDLSSLFLWNYVVQWNFGLSGQDCSQRRGRIFLAQTMDLVNDVICVVCEFFGVIVPVPQGIPHPFFRDVEDPISVLDLLKNR